MEKIGLEQLGELKEKLSRYQFFADKIVDLPSTLPRKIWSGREIGFQEVKRSWEDYLSQKNRYPGLGLYVHIPFCKKRCAYCCCCSEALVYQKDLDNYVKELIAYMEGFRKVFQKESFTSLYFGGGTPSLLGGKLLKELLDSVFGNFNFTKEGEKTFEMNPQSTSLKKLTLLRRYGFNRVSFGIQSLDKRVLKINERGEQTYKLVKDSIIDAKRAGFKEIDVDLIAGLYGDNQDTLLRSFKNTLSLGPTTVAVYPLSIVGDYLEKVGVKDLSYMKKFRSSVPKLFRALTREALKMGYETEQSSISGSFSFYRKDYCLSGERYFLHSLGRVPVIFGVGNWSVSKIPGKIIYEVKKMNLNLEDSKFFGGDLSVRTMMLERLIHFFDYKKFVLISPFKRDFHRDIRRVFKKAFSELELLGKIAYEGDKITLLSDGFAERIACCLFFFKESEVKKAALKKGILLSDKKII